MVDALRDGGSCTLVFDAADGTRHKLLLPVSVDASFKVLGHGPAKLLDASLSLSRDLEWGEARAIVEAARSLRPARAPDVDPVRLEELLAIVEREGQAP